GKVQLHPIAFNAPPKPIATHAGGVRDLVFTPQSNLVLSAGVDKVVKIADVATAAEVRTLGGFQAEVVALAVTPDGLRVVAAGADKNVLVFQIADGAQVANLAGATQPLTSVAVSPDGVKVATVSADNLLRMYVQNNLVMTVPVAGPTGIVFTKTPDVLAVLSNDKQIRLFAPYAPKLMTTHTAKVNAVATTPNGALLVSGGDDNLVRIFDVGQSKEVRTLAHGGAVLSLATAADNNRLVTGSADKFGRMWQMGDGAALWALPAAAPVDAVDFARDQQRAAFGSTTDGVVRVANAAGVEWQTFTVPGLRGVLLPADNRTVTYGSTDKNLYTAEVSVDFVHKHPAAVTAVEVNPAGLLATASADNTVALRDPNNGNPARSLTVNGPTALAFVYDNVKLAVAGADKIVRLFDVNSGAQVQEYPASVGAVLSLAAAFDNKSLAVGDADGGVAFLTFPENQKPGKVIQQSKRPGPTIGVGYSPDSKTFVALGGDRIVRYFAAPGPEVVDLPGHQNNVYRVAFSPDGLLVATASADNTVKVWDWPKATAVKNLAGHKLQVYGVAFSPDGAQLASCSADKTILLWDVASGNQIKAFSGAEDFLYHVAFSLDGKQIVGAGIDKTVRFWDVAGGTVVKTLTGSTEELYGLALSPTNRRAATCGYGGTLLVWDIDGGKSLFDKKFSVGAYDVAFHPNGALLAVAHADKKIYLIDVPPNVK
ncbi:MAG: WD40 repeat domain-containing protein, partial [Planctomycetia bacterium]